jgi:Tol biopolymer transport system component
MRFPSIDPPLRRSVIGFIAVIISILVFAWLAFGQYGTANHPELNWQTTETDHFFLHYDSTAARTAMVLAKIGEEIYPTLTELYDYAPDTKIHLIVKDTDDYANGGAYYYNNKIWIWATPLDYELRGTKNWLRDVMTHELTHMLQLGAARKLPRSIPAMYLQVMGYEEEKRPDVLYGYPNVLTSYPFAMTVMPMWFAEGTAQYSDPSYRFDYWDSHRDMQLRTRALDGELLNLDNMEVFGKNSLGNEGVYNHGYGLVKYIAETYGVDKLRLLTEQQKKLTRVSFNTSCRKVLGISAYELHDNWVDYLTEYYTNATDSIRTHQVAGEVIDSSGTANLYAKFSPDGEKLFYVSNTGSDYFGQRNLYALDRVVVDHPDSTFDKDSDVDDEPELIAKQVTHGFDITDDGHWIVYSKLTPQRNESNYSDLYLYDLEDEKEHRLTISGRAWEPAFNPEENKLVFVVNRDGTLDLATLDLPAQDEWAEMKALPADSIHKLTDWQDGRRAYRPEFNPRDGSILFAMSRDIGRDLMLIDADGSNLRAAVDDEGDQRDAIWGPSGRIVYYASDETGIFNIYRHNLATGQTDLLTNTIGGAVSPTLSPDAMTLVFSDWHVDGYKLSRLDRPMPLHPRTAEYGRDYVDQLPVALYNDTHVDTLAGKSYKPMFENIFFVPRIAWDYGSFKPGVYMFSSDYLEKLNFFGGFDMNMKGEFDAIGMLDFTAFRPTFFALGYYLTRKDDERFEDPFVIVDETIDENGELVPVYDDYGVDYTFNLMLFDIGARMNVLPLVDAELRASISRYEANLKYEDGLTFHYTYFIGKNYQARFDYNTMPAMIKGNVHPRAGTRAQLTVAYEDNQFIDGFEVDSDALTLQEVYTDYDFFRVEGDATHWFNPAGRLTVQPRVRFGYLDKQVDPFMHLYAGGLHGMRGYSFYSLGGTRKVIGSLALRHPIWEPNRPRTGWLHWDGLYAGVFGDVGDAWRERDFDTDLIKTDLGLELRAKFYSWYGYPTAVTFSAARAMDTVSVTENDLTTVYDPEWKFYFTVLFNFETIFPLGGTRGDHR